MALFSSPNTDLLTQGSLIVFMEVYLYFQGLYSVMAVTICFFLMGLGYRKARCGSRACIIVLGDIGRSPRMQYHALSLAAVNFDVEMVGYGGSKPHEDLLRNDKIKLRLMSDPPNLPSIIPRLLRYVFKVIWQSMQLVWVMLVQLQWPSHVLVQNPPAIPTLAVAWLCSRLYGSKFMIDWHNYGFTILGLTLGKDHMLVRITKWFEGVFAKWGDGHLCVTNAMKDDLTKRFGLKKPITLYDRPPKVFKETPLESQHELFTRLAEDYPVFNSAESISNATAFTERTSSGEIVRNGNRPALIVSSTSWTADEDISILLNALQEFDKAYQDGKNLPHIVCAITGKGQQKQHYQDIIGGMSLKSVKFCTPWLTAEDYPLLLGSSDLGVCLHTSSSGLDLPMKVVDMFGSGLPVCAVNFQCIGELVKHKENGLVFDSAGQLATQLQELLGGFPQDQQCLQNFRKNLQQFQSERWEENWDKTVRPTLYT
ncbi:chitobiosyldiphosphodolichol beta-mannosyltransferase-like [Patiria miniata]|uniref:Chitobiosyldiphosphodolichol beta-mannosyltransferase n=1 Tax=Patiria miniata TaxID=46514 RepID=A0A914ALB6_PATMI|nr:chitobiosyldiphosphodolichol beta-mannosyltransferase-like [Patiria miniata]